jgi:hypothetical protein
MVSAGLNLIQNQRIEFAVAGAVGTIVGRFGPQKEGNG